MPGKIDARLQELNITLPAPPAPVASYVPYVVTGNMVFISGQVTMAADGLKYVGKVGADISLEDGKAAARLCAINVIAQVKAACGGDLDRVKRCVKVGVFVNATSDFTQHPEIANGASDLFQEVFGDAGKHSRAAVGAGSLPARRRHRGRGGVRNRVTGSEFSARLAGCASDIGHMAWNACAGTENPFTRYEFFDAVETSGSATAKTGWRPLHLVVERSGRIEGILPLYLKNHSQGEYVFDRLGRRAGARGRRLLSEAAGQRAVHARNRKADADRAGN
ncbi:MAG: Atu1372/SO_1960 family protein [Rhizomicrobium sp.]